MVKRARHPFDSLLFEYIFSLNKTLKMLSASLLSHYTLASSHKWLQHWANQKAIKKNFMDHVGFNMNSPWITVRCFCSVLQLYTLKAAIINILISTVAQITMFDVKDAALHDEALLSDSTTCFLASFSSLFWSEDSQLYCFSSVSLVSSPCLAAENATAASLFMFVPLTSKLGLG